MRTIHFTKHALEKLSLMQQFGFAVDENTVVQAIRRPQPVVPGHSNRLVAQTMLDEKHVLRVVYEEDEEITVITVYPGRRERYEA